MQTQELHAFARDPERALAFYQEYGYWIEPQVWSPAEREALIRASESFPSFQEPGS